VVVLVVMGILGHLLSVFSLGRRDVTDPILENLALRQQLTVLQRSVKRPRLRRRDRAFCVVLSRVWRTGDRRRPSSNPIPWLAAIARGSGSTGAGGPGGEAQVALQSVLRSESSSARWLKPTPCGERLTSMESC
jgi:hypothetical protein